mmetsp:Transcript_59210/g.69238  ORF Transcript_59210/g.69238 Transcript_59210/m.69238 type:complete len:491 (+) Transcript_59210:244-1716(+)
MKNKSMIKKKKRAKGLKGIDMISSLEDLCSRLEVAAEQNFAASADQNVGLFMLGLPLPSIASNEVLNKLKPLYLDLLRDIKEKEEDSLYLRPLFDEDSPPSKAIVLLYFLQYPSNVRVSRGYISPGMKSSYNTESFNLVGISDGITANPVIGKYCRSVLAGERSKKHYHADIITSALGLLSAYHHFEHKVAKKFAKKIVFRGKDIMEEFYKLRSDLACICKNRKDLDKKAVVYTILLQVHVLGIAIGEENGKQIMMDTTSDRQIFERALKRCRKEFSEVQYLMFLSLLGIKHEEDGLKTIQEELDRRKITRFNIRCENKSCDNIGLKLCASCKVVSYCSKECQLEDWNAIHKQQCPGRKKKITVSSETTLSNARPALLLQEKLLKDNPGIDYIITDSSGEQCYGIQLSHSMGKMMFQMFRKKAPSSPHAVYRMYNYLLPGRECLNDIFRKQLQSEYGIDPLSDEARKAPEDEVSKMEDILDKLKADYPDA